MSHDDWCKDTKCGHKRREPEKVKPTTRGFVTDWEMKADYRQYRSYDYGTFQRPMRIAMITLNLEVDAEQADMLVTSVETIRSFDTHTLLDALGGK